MKFDRFKQRSSNLFAENRLLKFGFLMLLAISAYNATAISNVNKNQRTIIVPVGAAGKLEVTGDTASDDYLRWMARYMINLVGNYTAPNVRNQFEELTKLYAPEVYNEAHDYFMSLADQIEKYPTVASMVVWIGNDALKTTKGVMYVTTDRHRIVDGVTTRVDRVVYEVRYEIRSGQFVVLSITTPEDKTIRQTKEDVNSIKPRVGKTASGQNTGEK